MTGAVDSPGTGISLAPVEEQARFLSYVDIAELCGLPPVVLRRYRREGLLPAPDLILNGRPRWHPRTVQAWTQDRATRAAARQAASVLRPLEGDQLLRYRDIAAVTGLSVRVLRTYRHQGILPPPDETLDGRPQWRPDTIKAWLAARTARAAVRAAPKPAAPRRPNPATARHRAASAAALDPLRVELMAALRDGRQLAEASRALGTTASAVLGRARWDQQWRTEIDAAQLEGRDPHQAHGTLTTYQRGCRCLDCRTNRRIYDRRNRGLPG